VALLQWLCDTTAAVGAMVVTVVLLLLRLQLLLLLQVVTAIVTTVSQAACLTCTYVPSFSTDLAAAVQYVSLCYWPVLAYS
jgi:hypothetical protein